MFSSSTSDYYQFFDIKENATPEEIKKAYRNWMKLNHPDQQMRALQDYIKEGGDDPVILNTLKEALIRKTEEAKVANEAYTTLFNPLKRKSYDDFRSSRASVDPDPTPPPPPAPDPPKIIISESRLNFGRVFTNQKETMTFYIDNRGGPVTGDIVIEWVGSPHWADFIITPDPTNTFPIKVDVTIDTTGISPDQIKAKISVEIV